MVIYPLDSLCKLLHISNTFGYSFGIVLWSSILWTLCVNCSIFLTLLAIVLELYCGHLSFGLSV